MERARRAIWRTIGALRELGIKDGDRLYSRVYDARDALTVAGDALAAAEPAETEPAA